MILLRKLLPYLLATAVTLGLGYALYQRGYDRGSRDVRSEWDQDKAATKAAHDALTLTYAKREESQRLEQEKIADELAQARKQHEAALSNQRINFEQRLLQSSRRAEVYQRQAEAGATARRDLASHAARLDRALEEGRGLVEELGAALRLRDHQLKLLGDQIRNDRRLFADTGEQQ